MDYERYELGTVSLLSGEKLQSNSNLTNSFTKWTIWYESGQKESEVNYKNGQKDGKSTWWNKKGQKVKQKNYKNGKLDGKLIEWFQFNGQIKREENYKNGKICINEC